MLEHNFCPFTVVINLCYSKLVVHRCKCEKPYKIKLLQKQSPEMALIGELECMQQE